MNNSVLSRIYIWTELLLIWLCLFIGIACMQLIVITDTHPRTNELKILSEEHFQLEVFTK